MFFALVGIWLDFRWDGHRGPCLSNVALEEAIVALARIALLPPDHPAGRMARLAEQVPAPTSCSRFVPSWVLEDSRQGCHVLAIEECGLCPQELRNSCQESEHVRKGVLKQCRRLVVRPKLALGIAWIKAKLYVNYFLLWGFHSETCSPVQPLWFSKTMT